MGHTLIRTIEEASLGAWPGLQQVLLDGWVLRFANGYTRRANCVNPLYPGRADVAEKIAFCEHAYRSRGLAVTFKMTSAAEPRELDDLLEARGYERSAETSVQCLELGSLATGGTGEIRSWSAPADDWAAAFAQMSGVRHEDRPTLAAIVRAIAGPACFALRIADGSPVSCGLAVQQDGLVGLFDIATHPQHRRRGHAREIVRFLLGWGKAQGARTAYLQVQTQNAAALPLYAGLGFGEAYRYWYRTQP